MQRYKIRPIWPNFFFDASPGSPSPAFTDTHSPSTNQPSNRPATPPYAPPIQPPHFRSKFIHKKDFLSKSTTSSPAPLPTPPTILQQPIPLKTSTKTYPSTNKQLILSTQHLTNSLPTPYQLLPNSYHGRR